MWYKLMPFLPAKKVRPWNKPPPKTINSKGWSGEGFYQSAAWQRLSKEHKRENPLCVDCLKRDITKPVYATDHIKTREQYPELALEYSNLQSLCKSCHARKSAKERNNTKTNNYE